MSIQGASFSPGKTEKRIDLKQSKEKLKLEKELKTIDGTLREHYNTIQDTQKRFTEYDAQYQTAKKDREEKEKKINAL